MGLDIYLREIPNFKEVQMIETKVSKLSELAWEGIGKYEEMTEEQKDAVRKKIDQIEEENNCDDCGQHKSRKDIEIPSAKYPEHYFKIGYFRSSYNGGGINSRLSKAIGKDLYWIFDRERDEEYEFQPNWKLVREKVHQVQQELAEHIEFFGELDCFAEEPSLFMEASRYPQSENDALKAYLEVANSHKDVSEDCASFSNGIGSFNLKEPLRVRSILHGYKKSYHSRPVPCFYVIYENKGGWNWYLQALEIILETCDFVDKHSNKEDLYLAWSS